MHWVSCQARGAPLLHHLLLSNFPALEVCSVPLHELRRLHMPCTLVSMTESFRRSGHPQAAAWCV